MAAGQQTRIPAASGKVEYRIPDGLNPIEEWKLTDKVYLSSQIRDFMATEYEQVQEKRKAMARVIEHEFLEAWRKRSFPLIGSTGDIMKLRNQKLSPEVVEFILKWLPEMDNQLSSQEWLVRGLILAAKAFDGRLLTELFEDQKSDFNLRWAIGNTIESAKVLSVERWLEKTLLADYAKEKEMLVYGLWRYFPYAEAIGLAKKVFDKYPLHAANVFARIGRREDLDFLIQKFEVYNGPGKAQMKKHLKKMEARLSKEKGINEKSGDNQMTGL